jgi:hypothetical protein
MSHKQQLNLNINSYSDADLIDLLELSEPITEYKVFNKINKYKKKYKTNREIYYFFTLVESRMRDIEFNSEDETVEGFETIDDEDVDVDEDVDEVDETEMKSDDLILSKDVNNMLLNNANFNKGSQEQANINLERKQIKQIINVDSGFRKDYLTTNSNDFVFKLPIKLQNVVSLRLSSLEFPNTFYLFSNSIGNTTFTLRGRVYSDDNYTNLDISDELTITIPEGTWENSELASNINKMLDNLPNYTNLDSASERENYIYSKGYRGNIFSNLKMEIRDSDIRTSFRFKNPVLLEDSFQEFTENRFEYDLVFNDSLEEKDYSIDGYVVPELQNTAGWILGYRKAKYQNIRVSNSKRFFNDSVYGLLSAESLYAADKFNYVFFSVDDFNNSKDSIISAFKDVFISNNILGRISIKFGTFFVNLDDGSDGLYKQRDYPGPVTIEKLRIQVLNRYGELLDINNSDFSMTFEAIQLL